jgi:hypothetical protein
MWYPFLCIQTSGLEYSCVVPRCSYRCRYIVHMCVPYRWVSTSRQINVVQRIPHFNKHLRNLVVKKKQLFQINIALTCGKQFDVQSNSFSKKTYTWWWPYTAETRLANNIGHIYIYIYKRCIEKVIYDIYTSIYINAKEFLNTILWTLLVN